MPILKRSLGAVLSASIFSMVLLIAGAGPVAAATTLVVDGDSMGSAANCDDATPAYTTINLAVAAAVNGDTIVVCPGPYPELNVLINKSLTLLGARAGDPYGGRTHGDASESTVAGTFTVQAPSVRIDGFSLTNPALDTGIVVKTAGNDAVIIHNIIKGIGGVGVMGPTTAVYLELGPDRVRVALNRISEVQSIRSAQGILVGDSTSGDPSLDIVIVGNRIETITSAAAAPADARGAYGIQLNNGASAVLTATGYTTAFIAGNAISGLTGNWAHAIGLEGDTPGVVVVGNSMTNLVDISPAAVNDAIAVFFESNPSFATARVNQNNFTLLTTQWGIALHPTLNPPGTTAEVDGTCNWWNSSDGPGGPFGDPASTGAWVSDNVDYEPWLTSPAPGGDCKGDSDDGEECDEDTDGRHEENDGEGDDDDCDDDDDGDSDDESGPDTDNDSHHDNDDSDNSNDRSKDRSGNGSNDGRRGNGRGNDSGSNDGGRRRN